MNGRGGAKPRRLPRWLPPIIALFLICVPLAALAVSSLGSSSPDPLAQAAVAYARQQIIWDSGPTVTSVHVFPLRQLRQNLDAHAPPRVTADVNVSDLLRRYGPNVQTALVVLHGSFNSLPPGEGVTLHDAIVLLNARTKKGFFLMD
jgi:hypothetical protein